MAEYMGAYPRSNGYVVFSATGSSAYPSGALTIQGLDTNPNSIDFVHSAYYDGFPGARIESTPSEPLNGLGNPRVNTLSFKVAGDSLDPVGTLYTAMRVSPSRVDIWGGLWVNGFGNGRIFAENSIQGGRFYTREGSDSVANGDTLVIDPNLAVGVYLVSVYINLAGSTPGTHENVVETAIVGVVRPTNLIATRIGATIIANGAMLAISTSQSPNPTVSVTQTTGATQTVSWSLMKIA